MISDFINSLPRVRISYKSLALLPLLLFACSENKKKPVIEDKQNFYYSRQGVIKLVKLESNTSLIQIARQYGVMPGQVATLNSLSIHAVLPAGQMVKIPVQQFSYTQEKLFVPESEIEEVFVEESRPLIDAESGEAEIKQISHIDPSVVSHEFHHIDSHESLVGQSPQQLKTEGTESKTVAVIKNYSEPLDKGWKEAPGASLEPSQSPLVLDAKVETAVKPKTVSNFKYPTPLNLSDFIWPLEGKVLARYSKKGKKISEGLNISAPIGTPVKAIAAGEVIYTGKEPKVYGNLVVIKHANGYLSAYAHNEKIMVKKGESVRQGEVVATVGKTGAVTSPQLHFALRHGKSTVDPEDDLSKLP